MSDDGEGTIGWGTEFFSVWEGLPTVAEGSQFIYNDPSMDPTGEATDYYWGDGESNKALFSLSQGQGVVIDCAENLSIQTAGEVSDEPTTFTSIAGNNFTGNPYPQTIDIQSIKIDDDSAGTIGWGTEFFSVWEGLPTVAEGSQFIYNDPSMDPTGEATDYYWGDGESNKVSYSIPAGQGVVIDCAEGLTITITPPYSL